MEIPRSSLGMTVWGSGGKPWHLLRSGTEQPSPLESMPAALQTVIQESPTVAQAVLFRAAALGSLFLAAALARFGTMLAKAHQ